MNDEIKKSATNAIESSTLLGEIWLVFGISDKMYGEPKIDCFCFNQTEAQRRSNKLNEKARHYCYYVKKVKPND